MAVLSHAQESNIEERAIGCERACAIESFQLFLCVCGRLRRIASSGYGVDVLARIGARSRRSFRAMP